MMAKSAATIALEADPNDPEDFDVSEEALEQALAERRERQNRGGRPAGSAKERITLRIDKVALDRFRETGAGWQTRINAVLAESLKQKKSA